jgi:N-acetylmuramoyl-L-alanine amidase
VIIVDKTLRINKFSHPGKKMDEKRAVLLHWTSVPKQRALAVWEYFENGLEKNAVYASAHYCVDLDGTVYRFVPDDDVAYHCGSSQIDPRSGQVYTDWAREVFGKYASNPKTMSPNSVALGIEMCTLDLDGNFSNETLESTAELTAYLCETYEIPIERVGTHHMTVGYKDCPRLWTRYPEKFGEFRNHVQKLLRD